MLHFFLFDDGFYSSSTTAVAVDLAHKRIRSTRYNVARLVTYFRRADAQQWLHNRSTPRLPQRRRAANSLECTHLQPATLVELPRQLPAVSPPPLIPYRTQLPSACSTFRMRSRHPAGLAPTLLLLTFAVVTAGGSYVVHTWYTCFYRPLQQPALAPAGADTMIRAACCTLLLMVPGTW